MSMIKDRDMKDNGLSRSVKSKDKNSRHIAEGIILLAALIGLDQLTKYFAAVFLKKQTVIVIPGVFELYYLENRGAAFGMMKNMQWLFVLFALFIAAAAAYVYVRMPRIKRYAALHVICVVLAAGAVGNMIDRILHHYVIDFFYFSLINFPVFNVADIYVCASTGLLLLLFLFYYKEDDWQVLQGKKTRKEYMDELIEKIQESKHE